MKSALTIALLFLGLAPHAAAEPVRVVATLSPFAALVETVGGEEVTVHTVASPRFNPHFIEPRPSDVLKLKRAELFVHAGLDLEAWRPALVDAAANSTVRQGGAGELNLSQGIALLEVPPGNVSRAEGDIHLFGNPHYWLDPENGIVMAQAIERKLAELRPEQAATFHERRESFERALQSRIAEWRKAAAPFQGREVLAYHNEWVYLTTFLGITTRKFLEPKPGIPPSPRHIEELQAYIPTHHVSAIIQATFYPDTSSAALAERTGITLVKLCQTVREIDACSNYIGMLAYDVQTLLGSLS